MYTFSDPTWDTERTGKPDPLPVLSELFGVAYGLEDCGSPVTWIFGRTTDGTYIAHAHSTRKNHKILNSEQELRNLMRWFKSKNWTIWNAKPEIDIMGNPADVVRLIRNKSQGMIFTS